MASLTNGGDLAESNKALTISEIETLIKLFMNSKDSIPRCSQTDDSSATNATSRGVNGNGDAATTVCCSPRFFANRKKEEGSTSHDNGSSNGESQPRKNTKQTLCDKLIKFLADLTYMQISISNLKCLPQNVTEQFSKLHKEGQDLSNLLQQHDYWEDGQIIDDKVSAVDDLIKELKPEIRYLQMKWASERTGVSTVRNVHDLFTLLLEEKAYEKFKKNTAIMNFEDELKSLDVGLDDKPHRRCLLYFSVFPENAVVPKRMLMYWWIAEHEDPPEKSEEVVDKILHKFEKLKYIEPILSDRKKLIGFRMYAMIRFAVIFLAEHEKVFSFDSTWNPTGDLTTCQKTDPVKNEEGDSKNSIMSLREELFLKMKSNRVLSLGRWEYICPMGSSSEETRDKTTKAEDIQLDAAKFLNELNNLKCGFLSLHGVSGVEKLPKEVLKLTKLLILDLKACKDLKALPESIDLLVNLTHIDVSECPSLDCIPVGILSLSKLQVLKGFVIDSSKGNGSCTIDDLSKLEHLIKLTIRNFPVDEDFEAIQRCRSLRKLTIAWIKPETSGGTPGTKTSRFITRLTRSITSQPKNQPPDRTITEKNSRLKQAIGSLRDSDLEKLELKHFPHSKLPWWLLPNKMKSLNKLYIKGGNLQYLNEDSGEVAKWNVKILRLESLYELTVKWMEFQVAFPDLIYLEKVECPKMFLFPCRENGVLVNWEKVSDASLENLGLRWSFLSTKPNKG